MKTLVVSDLHFKVSNTSLVNKFVEETLRVCTEERPELIVLLGDVLNDHERLHVVPYNKALDFIACLRNFAPTFVLVGNHDLINNQEFLTSNHWLNPMKHWSDVCVVDKHICIIHDKTRIDLLPYVPPGRFQEALDTAAAGLTLRDNSIKRIILDPASSWTDSNLIFAHQEFFGCSMGAIHSTKGDVWPEDAPPVISGHIHQRQTPQSNIYYPGSAMQVTYGDKSKPHVLVMDTRLGLSSTRTIPLAIPIRKTITVNAEDFATYQCTEDHKNLKLVIRGQCEAFKAIRRTKQFKELLTKGCTIVYKPTPEEIHVKGSLKTTDFMQVLTDLVADDPNQHAKRILEMIVK